MLHVKQSTMVDMSTIGERMRAERIAQGLTLEDLADAAGVSKQGIGQIERGDTKSPMATTLMAVATKLRVHPDWLIHNRGPKRLEDASPDPRLRPIMEWTNADELDPNQHVVLPRLEVHLSAGNGDGVRDSEPASYNAGQAYRADFVKRKGWSPKTHFSMYVKGDSMEPTIPDGSVVVIDVSDKKIRSGSIYAVKVDDELRLKRLHKLPGGVVRVESDNPAPRYKAFEVGGEDAKGFKVIGRAVNLTTDL